MSYQYRVAVYGAPFGLLLGLAALARLLWARRFGPSNIAPAASAIGCAALGVWAGLFVYFGG